MSQELSNSFDDQLKYEVLENLNAKTLNNGRKLYNLDVEYEQIFTLLENTFKYRDGKSCIVVGPRGSGKTILVEQALNHLKNEYEFFVIHLNGSIFKDDSHAIKEIARQLDWYLEKYNPKERSNLKKATETTAKFEQKTVANTMNVIISILDRTRLNEDNDSEYTENTGTSNKTKKKSNEKLFIPIIFVIDEIDKYTHTSKQTLLYNLFDMAQSSSSKKDAKDTSGKKHRGTTISVIGISTKTTVREQLEKRVKSRFSQRIIHVNKMKSLEEFIDCVNHIVKLDMKNDGKDIDRAKFNEIMGKLIFQKGGVLRKKIVQNFYTIKDLRSIKNELIVFVMTEFKALIYEHLKNFRNRNLEMMKGLSESELKLLICCCRVKIKNSIEVFNFDMVFNEYYRMKLMERREIQAKIQISGISLKENDETYLMDRDAMQLCWENLFKVGILERRNGNIASVSKSKLLNTVNGTTSFSSKTGTTVFYSTTAAETTTPTGASVCGVQLGDVLLSAESDPAADTAWIAVWSRVAA